LTFLNPLFLIGLSLVAVPIIIHLWFKKRLQKIPFSTLTFLKKTEAKRFGWLKFREILILILRCLFIAFLFLSLARPQLSSGIFKTHRLASLFLVVDNSYSMAYGENFQLAKEMAYKVLSLYSTTSEFCILPLCPAAEQNDIEKPFWTTKKSALELVKKLDLSYKSCSIRDVLLHIPDEKPQYPIEYIYIGDGQELNFKDFPTRYTQKTLFYWLKIPTGGNVGITRVSLKDPIAMSLDNYDLNVVLSNFSPRLWTGRVGLRAGDYYYEKNCEIDAGKNLSLEFLLPVSIHRGKVTIYGDSLAIDNVYFFSKVLPQKLNVLIVGSDEFLRIGLSPSNELMVPFYVETVGELSRTDLRKFDVVILNGINDISVNDKIKLAHFLNRDETGIICFLGSEVGENLTQFIKRCCTIENQISPKGYVTLDWVDYGHPVFNVFKGSTALKNVKFYYFNNIIADNGIIARLSGNYPFIVIHDNLAIVAVQFTPQTTNIMYKTGFVPLLYRLIVSLAFRTQDREFYVGTRPKTFKKLKAPTGEYLSPESEFLIPGFYTTDDDTLGVNVTPDEGNLTILGNERAKILNIHTINVEKDLTGGDLTTPLLYLALFVILLELVLLLI